MHARLERLLRWSERYTKTDMVYLLRNSGWLTLGQVGVAGTALLLSIAFAHFVPKETYGTYRYLLSIFWILSAFCFTGLPTAVTQAVARGFEGAYLRSFRVSLLWSMPMAVLACGTSAYYFLQGNISLGYGLLVIAVLGPLFQPALLFASFLEGKRDFMRYTLYGVAVNIVPALLSFAAMFVTSEPLAFLGTYLVGNVATGFLCNWLAYRVHSPNSEVNPELERLSFHFSLMNVLSTIANQIDKLLVFHYLGAAQLAVYAFATALPEQVKGVFNNVAGAAFPKFSSKDPQELRGNFWGRIGLFTIVLIVATAAYIFIAPYVFHWFFPAYEDAIFYSQVFALSLIVVSNTVPLTLLQAQAAQKELYIFNIISPIFQIGVLFFLTITYGLMGTIVARIVTRIINTLLLAGLVEYYWRRGDASAPENVV